ncbi:MAG: DPP IV N-terminal domain-containing protein [Ardenticatenaceae bacterium]|nr:DPP IV N-terminal domain-containing protein [Ardenticatenaceae bacterium]
MTGLRFAHLSLVVTGIAVVLTFGAIRRPGAVRGTEPPLDSGPGVQAASVPRCMSCHQTRGAISQIQQLTDEGRNLRPAWSPDGQKVAFYSNRTGNDEIWVADLQTGDQRPLTSDPASDRRPAWSPDGQWLAFDSDRAGNRDIWVVRADGSGLRQVTTSPREELFASWSPDGQQLAYFSYGEGTNELWLSAVDGSHPRPLVAKLASEQQQQCSFACHQASWNQSGEQLAFHSDQGGNRDIWLVNVDGTGLTRVTSGPEQDYFPTWTPDGRIIFMTERLGTERVWNDVRLINADGTQETTLFSEVAHGGPFDWSPDGNRIALHSQLAGNDFNIFVATLGEPPGDQPTAETDEAASTAPEATESAVEQAAPPATPAVAAPATAPPPASGAGWSIWLAAGAALVIIVAVLSLGAIGLYLRRTGSK